MLKSGRQPFGSWPGAKPFYYNNACPWKKSASVNAEKICAVESGFNEMVLDGKAGQVRIVAQL
jgi:hypothetical protein